MDLDTEGVQETANLEDYVIYGGAEDEKVESTSIFMTGGRVADVYGGGEDGDIAGNTSVTVTGGTVVNVYGGSQNGNVVGNTNGYVELVGVAVGETFDNAILKREDDNWEVKGNPTIPKGVTMTISENTELAISDGSILTCEGTLINRGTIENNGTIRNEGDFQNNGKIIGSGRLEGRPIEDSNSSGSDSNGGGGTSDGGNSSSGGGTSDGGNSSSGGGTPDGGNSSSGGGTPDGGNSPNGGGTSDGGNSSSGGGMSDGGNSSSGGGTSDGDNLSNGGSPSNGNNGAKEDNSGITPPGATELPKTSTKTITTVKAKYQGDKATATLSSSVANSAIKRQQAEAKKNGKETDDVAITVKVDTKKAKEFAFNLPKATIAELMKNRVGEVGVSSGMVTTSLDLNALKEIRKQSTKDITITKVNANDLSASTKKKIGKRPIYGFSITDKTGKKITKFGKGKIRVSIPYKLAAKEKADNLVIYYINANGKAVEVPNSVYSRESKTISFATNHLSKFAVGYKGKTI
ncbi:hypothetical protein [Velocimicrobium porci]|uniref:Uncharacterized protein n=1 Tax=Velocimicrobium porci TaxID=2606634 RepID=A0A6L5XU81_9FIRM|nr:hypothetical protein [Velocimicrobium porci]MSS62325.1 hypothetical protein [Velocimicrobium porci]